jgi:hypothetical protein
MTLAGISGVSGDLKNRILFFLRFLQNFQTKLFFLHFLLCLVIGGTGEVFSSLRRAQHPDSVVHFEPTDEIKDEI